MAVFEALAIANASLPGGAGGKENSVIPEAFTGAEC
jgi:hypothetical protein